MEQSFFTNLFHSTSMFTFPSAVMWVLFGMLAGIFFIILEMYCGHLWHRPPSEDRRNKLSFYAQLAKTCYDDDCIDNLEVNLDGWRARAIAAIYDRKIWIWEVIEPKDCPIKHIVAIRGTSTIQDWIGANFQLFCDALREEVDDCALFTQTITIFEEHIKTWFMEHRTKTRGIIF